MDTLKEITKLAESLEVKTCTKCGKTKHGDEISVNQSWCKMCVVEYNKKYREENKEMNAEHQKKYREENKEMLAERQKKYYEENKEVIAGYSKKRNELLPDLFVKARIKIQYKCDNEDITPEMIEIKRAQIKLKRMIK